MEPRGKCTFLLKTTVTWNPVDTAVLPSSHIQNASAYLIAYSKSKETQGAFLMGEGER